MMFHNVNDDGLECIYPLRFNGTRSGDANIPIDAFTCNY